MIKANADWQFVGIYTDEGISGTSTNRREGFKQMITDALAGKIDLIVTKSVSRFARNTVDSLTTIRNLKENKVEVYFEKENIKTFDSKGELLITIMSSLAQEESRSISENVKWGLRKRFADGQVIVPFSCFLGYDRGPEGTLVVNPEQARTVRYIYALFLQGMSFNGIATRLTAEGHGTPGGQAKWHDSTVSGILSNEKYKGDALLQKYYIPDFLTKKAVVNKGDHRSGDLRPGAAGDRKPSGACQATQGQPSVLTPHPVCGMRSVLRPQDLALQRPIPQGRLAV